MTPKAEIISIGDELLYGQTLNTNAYWMSSELDKIGIRIIRNTTIGDDEQTILEAFADAESRADIILITGGLGPTNDDLTKPCLATYFNCELTLNKDALKDLEKIFKFIGRELTEINRKQAELPSCCEKITNSRGTAPGMWFNRDGKVFVSMPGVPGEMKQMMIKSIIPRLQEDFNTDVIFHKIIKTVGIGESWLSEEIDPWVKNLPSHISLAYLPELGQVKLRLTATGEDRERLKEEVNSEIEDLKHYASKYIYGYDSQELHEVIGDMLVERNLSIATAESCTGGYIAHLITSISGSSRYYRGSIVPYHNSVKQNLVGVEPSTLEKFGAVSEQTVIELAESVRKNFNADIGVSTSGIAGPTGGTPDKPVGTIWIACSYGSTTKTKKLQLYKDRMMNIQSTSVAVLNMVRLTLAQTVEIKS